MSVSPPPPFVGGRQVLTDGVYEALLARLIDGSLGPGSPLRTEAIAKELQVSATPVREALARLESTGMVVRAARRGYRVASLPTPEEMRDLIDLRLILEPVNAERACARADAEFLESLAETVHTQQQAPTGPHYENFKEFLTADWTFHRLIAGHTGNPQLARMFDTFNGYMQRYRLFGDHEITDAHESRAEHTAILEAFRAHRPVDAADAMRRHLENLLVRATART